MFKLVENKNRLAVHGIFSSKEKAELFIKETLRKYVEKGYYMDKTLTKDSFTIIKEK